MESLYKSRECHWFVWNLTKRWPSFWKSWHQHNLEHLVVFVWPCWEAWGPLSSLTTDWTWATEVNTATPNHWMAREFPWIFFFELWTQAQISLHCGIWPTACSHKVFLAHSHAHSLHCLWLLSGYEGRMEELQHRPRPVKPKCLLSGPLWSSSPAPF